MDLYLIRHAIAEERRPDLLDSERALTERGRERFERAARRLARLGYRFDTVLTSPWRRARQTATLLAPLAESVEVLDALAAPPDEALLAALDASRAGERRALVGHQPWLGELAAWLAFGNRRLGPSLRLGKGSLVHLRGEAFPGGMVLRGLVPPKTLWHADD